MLALGSGVGIASHRGVSGQLATGHAVADAGARHAVAPARWRHHDLRWQGLLGRRRPRDRRAALGPRRRGSRSRRQPVYRGHRRPPHPQGHARGHHLDLRRQRQLWLLWRRGPRDRRGAQLPPGRCPRSRRQPLHRGQRQQPHPQGQPRGHHLDLRRQWQPWLLRRRRPRGRCAAQQPRWHGPRSCGQPLHRGHHQQSHPQGHLRGDHLDLRRQRQLWLLG